jgi:peptidoglycan/LPS O-acetylase OafA/YrhL
MILAGGLIGLCVLVLRRLTVGDVSWRGVALVAVSNILLLPSNALIGFRSYSFLLNSPFWSLSWEMVVGLIYAILARGLTFARLLTILAAGALAVVLLSLRKGGLDTGFYWTDFDLGFVRAVFPFFAGVALRQGLRLHPTRKALDLPTLGLLALALLTPVALSPALEFLAVLVLFPGIAIMGASAEASPRLGRLWARMGDLSYPLYAVHYPIIVVVAQVAKHLHGAKLYLAGLATTLAVIALAQLLLMLYDRPLRAWLNRMRRPSGPRPSAPLKATAAPRG